MGLKVKLPSLLLNSKAKSVMMTSDHNYHCNIFNSLFLLDVSDQDEGTHCRSPVKAVDSLSSSGTCLSSSSIPSSMSFISDDADVSDAELGGDDLFIEDIIRRTQSDTKRRLIFQPEETSSVLVVFEKNKQQQSTDHKDEGTHHHLNEEDNMDDQESSLVVMVMQSDDPYLDFTRSMEEILETQRLLEDDNNSQWGRLEELLSWYLCVNGKSNHGYIVGAFVDLLMNKLYQPHRT